MKEEKKKKKKIMMKKLFKIKRIKKKRKVKI